MFSRQECLVLLPQMRETGGKTKQDYQPNISLLRISQMSLYISEIESKRIKENAERIV